MNSRFGVALLFLGSVAVTAPLSSQESSVGVGSRAPVVTVRDLDGKPVDLGQYLGKKPVFLEFWATWCELCEQLLPRVSAARAAYGSQVEFFGINVTVNQSPEKIKRYLQQHKPAFRTLYDEEGSSIRAYGVPATSYVVIVDRTGKIAYTGSGGAQDFDPALRQVTGQ
ncbi:MAG TPA: TlpA disulfide reductase family protein [Gemmatimonadales bacterium]|nr:TlpA disulfide reductase family protein [Gemmatimonadales bacterium]